MIPCFRKATVRVKIPDTSFSVPAEVQANIRTQQDGMPIGLRFDVYVVRYFGEESEFSHSQIEKHGKKIAYQALDELEIIENCSPHVLDTMLGNRVSVFVHAYTGDLNDVSTLETVVMYEYPESEIGEWVVWSTDLGAYRGGLGYNGLSYRHRSNAVNAMKPDTWGEFVIRYADPEPK